MKMNVDDLSGAALDWAVAKFEMPLFLGAIWTEQNWHPSTNWVQGGELMQRERIGFWFGGDKRDPETGHITDEVWFSEGDEDDIVSSGATPLIAAMRMYVKLALINEEVDELFVIDIPEEVLKREVA